MGGEDTMHPAPRVDSRLTYEDFLLFPDDGQRHELIDGEHYVSPSPNRRHQRLSRRLILALGSFLESHPDAGEVFSAPFDVVLSNFDVVEPDLLLITGDQQDISTDTNVRGAPALVVEILSPSTRRVDEKTKRLLFERTGVREYWVVDPELDLIKVYRRATDGSFPRVAELTAEATDTLKTALLPDFELALTDLFR
jgi:Uma2 family endonuclease